MHKVQDQSGRKIPGLLKNNLGALVVENNSEYNKYMIAKQQAETIQMLKKDLDSQTQVVSDLLKEMHEMKSLLLAVLGDKQNLILNK